MVGHRTRSPIAWGVGTGADWPMTLRPQSAGGPVATAGVGGHRPMAYSSPEGPHREPLIVTLSGMNSTCAGSAWDWLNASWAAGEPDLGVPITDRVVERAPDPGGHPVERLTSDQPRAAPDLRPTLTTSRSRPAAFSSSTPARTRALGPTSRRRRSKRRSASEALRATVATPPKGDRNVNAVTSPGPPPETQPSHVARMWRRSSPVAHPSSALTASRSSAGAKARMTAAALRRRRARRRCQGQGRRSRVAPRRQPTGRRPSRPADRPRTRRPR
jgi:hypothetical protein